MSRLDRHIHSVRNKLAVAGFVEAIAQTAAIFAVACVVALVIDRTTQLRPPRFGVWIWSAAGISVLAAAAMAILRRPSFHAAAVAIDEKLSLNEKFSTALSLKAGESANSDDPFARAALLDAEKTAEKTVVDFRRHFPLKIPRFTRSALISAVIALAMFYLLPQYDLLGRAAAADDARKQQQTQAAVKAAEQSVRSAIAKIEAIPRAVADDEAVKKAKLELENLLRAPIVDPAAANRAALKSLADVNDALKRQAENVAKAASDQSLAGAMQQNQPPAGDKSPVAEAQRSLAQSEFAKAAENLRQLANDFNKMTPEQQKKAAEQMAALAQQLQKAAQNPQTQQQLQQQLGQMGMNSQQAQQMAQMMQQVAQNPAMQQQMQQLAQQFMQQMNNGQGPTPQQQKQIQDMLKKLQSQQMDAVTQQKMAEAMRKMAEAMQKQQNGQQGEMQEAMAELGDQLQQMEAMAQDAEQLADAQADMESAMADVAASLDGFGNGNQPGDGEGEGQGPGGTGPWRAGEIEGSGSGSGGPGRGNGRRAASEEAPFDSTKVRSPTRNQDQGRVLASTFIKDNQPIRGSGTAPLRDIAAAAEQDAADEIDLDRVSRSAKGVVRDYFGAFAKEQPAPAPAPPAGQPK